MFTQMIFFSLYCSKTYRDILYLIIFIYNKHYRVSSVKQNIKDQISKEADHYLGESMTFTLIEFLKDFAVGLVADQPDKEVIENITKLVCISN